MVEHGSISEDTRTGERLRTIERFRRVNFGRIERQVTLIDEEFYKRPIVLDVPMSYAADTDMLEYVCAENPRSRPHLIGRTEAERQVVVRPAVLRRYVGTYDAVGWSTGGPALGTTSNSLARKRSIVRRLKRQGPCADDADVGGDVQFAIVEPAVLG